jgi:hypothetical protein
MTTPPQRPSSKPTLLQLASDPTLIKGIHEACDQWCMYCGVTHRCLAFRCAGVEDENPVWDTCSDDFTHVMDGVVFLKDLAEVEGRQAPPEIEVMVSRDRDKQAIVDALSDPLEHVGRNYMDVSSSYLVSRPDYPFDIARRPSGPTPLEVFAWDHALVPARIFRAILNAAEAAKGVTARHEDALRAAKVALIGIDRSLTALASMATEDDDPRLELLQAQLRRLRREVDARFPGARDFVRTGLDDGSDD